MAAGLAVTFLIVPQGLSYASSIAGLPAIYGLYSDFVPLLLFAVYTTSQYLQVGAVAIVSLLTYEAITKLVAPKAAAGEPAPPPCLCVLADQLEYLQSLRSRSWPARPPRLLRRPS